MDDNLPFVIVRTYSAGVHMGFLESHFQTVVVLRNARRLWSWAGAFTLHEVSSEGVSDESRISAAVDSITLTQAIEIIPCTKKAEKNLMKSRNG
jgi:hypothetical protein